MSNNSKELRIFSDSWKDKGGNTYIYYFIGYLYPMTLHSAIFFKAINPDKESEIILTEYQMLPPSEWTDSLIDAWCTTSKEQAEAQITLLEVMGYDVAVKNPNKALHIQSRKEMKSKIN
jgi:hypothetical protein